LAERAARLTDYKDAEILDVLAAALAEARRYDEAINVASAARDLAITAGKKELVPMIESRLQLYHLQLPYRAAAH
jgi:hypothetical protein